MELTAVSNLSISDMDMKFDYMYYWFATPHLNIPNAPLAMWDRVAARVTGCYLGSYVLPKNGTKWQNPKSHNSIWEQCCDTWHQRWLVPHIYAVLSDRSWERKMNLQWGFSGLNRKSLQPESIKRQDSVLALRFYFIQVMAHVCWRHGKEFPHCDKEFPHCELTLSVFACWLCLSIKG